MQFSRLTQLARTLGAGLVVLVLTSTAWADDRPKSGTLDDQLLDDLSTDLLPEAPAKRASAPKDDEGGLDQKLLDQLDGEDIELGEKPNPFTQIGRKMRTVERRISDNDTSVRTQEIQKEILSSLDALLEQTRKQCQGQCEAPSGSKPKPASAAGNKPGENLSQKPRDSDDRLRDAGKTDVDEAADMDQLVKQVWGHLPDKVRSQMQNVSVENFLPKYEKLIEAYYKRLAEEEAR